MDMTPTQVLWMGIGTGALMVLMLFAFTLRDFLNPYFSVRFGKGKRLLRVHLNDGYSVRWRVGFFKNGAWMYKHAKKDERMFSITDGVAKRSMGVQMIDLPENATAPFNFKIVKEYVEYVKIPLLDDNGEEQKDKENKVLTEKVPVVRDRAFKFYDDSKALCFCLESALTKKTSRQALGFGNLDGKKIIFLILGAVVLWYIVSKFVLPTIQSGATVI